MTQLTDLQRLITDRMADRWRDDSERTIFMQRLDDHLPALTAILSGLYGDRPDCANWIERILLTAAEAYCARPADLKRIDSERSPVWFQSNAMLGGMCYVDRYATNLAGLRERIPYFRELGLTYLHLMPLFRSPSGPNDGGYAVSSFREVRPDLGTMDDLADLAREFRSHGISLVLDFVMNHTADSHDWANAAKAGDVDKQQFYHVFPDRTLPDAYEQTLREIFPDQAPGNFTFVPELNGWVWTTFNTYQWDLNYANPAVFDAMLGDMLFLANQGVEVLRLDAVPFLWKQMGTTCENLPQAHDLIAAYRLLTQIVAPSLIFKSEAIVHPDEVARFIGRECQVSYNPLLMVLLWDALATGKTALMHESMRHRFALPPATAWVNYIRSHDDIGWGFANEDADAIHLDGGQHRDWLNQFYTGALTQSFASGFPFNYNPRTHDMRISGATASLAGLERAMKREDEQEIALAIRRIVLLIGFTLSMRGIPLIFLGDEIGTTNDYSYQHDPALSADNRWLHRPRFNQRGWATRHDPSAISGRIYQTLQQMMRERKRWHAFAADGVTRWLATDSEGVIAVLNEEPVGSILILANFTSQPRRVEALPITTMQAEDVCTGTRYAIRNGVDLDPYALLWLRDERTSP